jgi:membrane protein
MTRLEKQLIELKPVQWFFRLLRGIYPPFFEGLSLFYVCRFFFRELGNSKVNERAAAVTYNFLMAIPPTMMFLFSLVPYLPLQGVQHTILDTINYISPNVDIRRSFSKLIIDFMHRKHRDILSFGILLTLYFSSNGMMGLIRSFDRDHSVYVKRNSFKRRWTAIRLTFMLIVAFIFMLAVLIIQSNAINKHLERLFNTVLLIKWLSILFVVIFDFFTISMIYKFGPSLTNRSKFVSAGSVFATIGSVVTTTIFFFAVNHFLNYNKVYGPIGTLIAFMGWVWLTTMVILLGYELNVSILLGKTSHAYRIKQSKT